MQSRFRLALDLSLCILLGGCFQNPPAPVATTPAPKPIPLGEGGSHPLIFRNVAYRIPTGTILGEVRVGGDVVDEMRWTVSRSKALDFNVSVTDGLRELGYDMRDSVDALFEPTGDVKIRYVMAAVLHKAALDFEYDYSRRRRKPTDGVGTADVEVEVQLHDAIANRTVYTRTFTGHGQDEGLKPNPIISAVVNAVLKSTTDPDFVRIVSNSEGRTKLPVPLIDEVEIATCRREGSMSLPDDIPEALEAVVEILVGGGAATGVIISPDGWIVTAAHVVNHAAEVWIRFANGIQLPATLERVNNEFDVALLRIQGRGYPCGPLRSGTKNLELGKEVFAINLAIGDNRSPTISRGVVSGYPEQEARRFIQTDASVNPGSSGGPLFASDGTVAGITVAKFVGIGIEGFGLAVPIHDVIEYLSIRLDDD